MKKQKIKSGGFFSSDHSIMIPRPPEEIMMLSQMPSAVHSDMITNEFFLNANIKYDACTCCASLPSISIPLTVIPMTHMESYGFMEPAGYAPMELGYFKFTPETVHH